MALNRKIKASSTIEAIVSVAIISAMMMIIFPFFGQILTSNHRMEMIRGLHLWNNLQQTEEFNKMLTGDQEFPGDGIALQRSIKQDEEIPELYHITTIFVSANKKDIYTITEFKYHH